MSSTGVAIPAEAEAQSIRLPIGLIVATGDTVPTRDGKSTRPIALSYFRPKAGQLDQYAAAVAKFTEVYPAEPAELDDVLLFSNLVWESLDIRYKAWGTSGPRIIGKTNFAAISDKDDYLAAIDQWDDEIAFYPLTADEVLRATRSKERADAWEGEPLIRRLSGPDDKMIEKYGVRVETTFRFGLPRVLGLGKVVLYATTSSHNRDNLRDSLWFASEAFRGNLIGIRFRLAVRPRRARYFDKEKRAKITTDTFEVVLDTPWTLQEALEAVREQREVLGATKEQIALPSGEFFSGTSERKQVEEETRILALSRNLPDPPDEDTRVRDEPSARPDEAQLNRLANLAQTYGNDDGITAYLVGSFGVESFENLTSPQAAQAEAALARLVKTQKPLEGEYSDPGPEAPFAGMDAQPPEQASFESMVPESVKKEYQS